MNLVDRKNRVLDAECSIDVFEGAPCVVVESSGGSNPSRGVVRRNPDYNKLLMALFERLAMSRVKITKVVLDSAKVANIPIAERVAKLTTPYPVDLESVDIDTFRKELQHEISLMHRSPSAKKGGNAQKKIRIVLERNIDVERLVFPREHKEWGQEPPVVTSGLNETQKQYMLTARVGQGEFRKSLIKAYGAKCPITGIENEKLLVASHIKPWNKCTNAERLDPDNGILLSALADRLFDQGLVTFENDGSVLMSPTLSESDKIKCGLNSWPRVPLSPGSRHYMEYHRAVEFNRT
jgi:hypothetical protein